MSDGLSIYQSRVIGLAVHHNTTTTSVAVNYIVAHFLPSLFPSRLWNAPPRPSLYWHTALVAASWLVIDALPRFTKLVPSPLAALVMATVASNHWSLPVPRIVDVVGTDAFSGGMETVRRALLPFFSSATAATATAGATTRAAGSWLPPFQEVLLDWKTVAAALPVAAELAFVGILQSLLTLQIVDGLLLDRGRTSKECRAQGLGNFLSGAMGGMGGSALLGQSLVNVKSGGRGRLSSASVAAFVLLGIATLGSALGTLPVAALVGLMLSIAQHTFAWSSLRLVREGKVPPAEAPTILAVSVITFTSGMAVSVGVGVLASALRFAWQASCDMRASEKMGRAERGSSP